MAAVKSNKTSTKLKAGKKKPINKWLIAAGVAAVAVVGVVVVRLSGASGCNQSGYVFVRCASIGQITGTKLVSGGVIYKKSPATTLVSTSEINSSSKICAHWKVISIGSSKISVMIEQMRNVGGRWYPVAVGSKNNISSTGTGNVCLSPKNISGTKFEVGYGGANISGVLVGVDTVYGK